MRRKAAGLVLALTALGAWADVPLATAIRFNTVCARCHEGECSGRLSFGGDQLASANHVERYLGVVSPGMLGDLNTLLAHMKTACSYAALPVALPRDGVWRAEALAPLRNDADRSYFIPLGVLAVGHHRASLRFDGAVDAVAQVISAAFDISEHTGLTAADGKPEFVFGVERREAHYLRLRLNGPETLTELRVASPP